MIGLLWAQRAELEARVAEQARQLEAFQRQEAERARAAAAAAAALPAPSALQQQPLPALTLQGQIPQRPAVTEAALQLSLQPSAGGSGSHAPQPLPLSGAAVRGFNAHLQYSLEQQVQQQPQQQARVAVPPQLTLQWEGGRGIYEGRAMPLQHQQQHQAAGVGHQMFGREAAVHPTLRSHNGLAAVPARTVAEVNSAAQGEPAFDWNAPPPQRAAGASNAPAQHDRAGFDWNAAPPQPAAPTTDAAARTGAGFDWNAPPPQRAPSYARAQDEGCIDWNAPPPQQAKPAAEQDGIQQLQALMAALPQFAGLAARLNKVGASSCAPTVSSNSIDAPALTFWCRQ